MWNFLGQLPQSFSCWLGKPPPPLPHEPSALGDHSYHSFSLSHVTLSVVLGQVICIPPELVRILAPPRPADLTLHLARFPLDSDTQ